MWLTATTWLFCQKLAPFGGTIAAHITIIGLAQFSDTKRDYGINPCLENRAGEWSVVTHQLVEMGEMRKMGEMGEMREMGEKILPYLT
jgi:hypothetical protein